MENRREHPRHELDWPIYLCSEAQKRRVGELVNISLNGVKMSIEETFIPRSDGQFELFLCHPYMSAEMLEIRGVTVWMHDGDDDRSWGLKLVDLDEHGKKALSEFIDNPDDLAVELEIWL